MKKDIHCLKNVVKEYNIIMSKNHPFYILVFKKGKIVIEKNYKKVKAFLIVVRKKYQGDF